ncbi:MAG: hypothetical protein IPK04_21745 [Bdellovibrionales bacterium]|nr:hypothetical protein [Bdellovibrionales bacterium]
MSLQSFRTHKSLPPPNSVNLVALAPATPNTESSQVVDFETVAVETVASKSEQEETGASEIVASETMPTQKIAHPKTTSPVSSVLSSEPSWLELAQTKGPEIFNKLCLSLFAEMKAYFDHTILLSYNEATQNVLALTWDVDLNESASKLYSLEAPSVLRIVKNTEKPYHGSPVINDFNEKFF